MSQCLLSVLALVAVTLAMSGPSGALDGADPTDGGFVPLSPVRLFDSRELQPPSLAANLEVRVTGVGGIPATGVGAVVLSVTLSGRGFLTVYPTGEARPLASNANGGSGVAASNLVTVGVGSDGQVSFYRQVRYAAVVVDAVGYFPVSEAVGGTFRPVVAARLLDTRATNPPSPLTGGTTRNLTVTGSGGVPGGGVGAVVLNVTAVNPAEPIFLTVWPAGTSRPLASQLNADPGEVVPNLIVAPVGTNGQVSLYANRGPVDVVVDVLGWFPSGSQFNPLTPARLADTREGLGVPPGPIEPCSYLEIPVLGRGGVPASGVGSVVLNVTIVNPSSTTYFTAWPAGAPAPLASNVTAPAAGRTRAGAVTVPVGADGKVSILNYTGLAHLVVDVGGWFPPAPGGQPAAADAPLSSCSQGSGGASLQDISADGRFVLFSSTAENLVAHDVNGQSDLFVKDRANGNISRVDLGADNGVVDARISDDGRWVLAHNVHLPPAPVIPPRDGLVLYDRASGTSQELPGPSYLTSASLSGDGNVVAFAGSNEFPNPYFRLHIWRRSTGAVTDLGKPAQLTPTSLSYDGRFLGYAAPSAQPFGNDTVPTVLDLTSLAAHRGPATAMATTPWLTADGSHYAIRPTWDAGPEVVDVTTGTVSQNLPLAPGFAGWTVGISGNGRFVVGVEQPTSWDNSWSGFDTLQRWDLQTGTQVTVDRLGGGFLGAATVSDAGDVLFTEGGKVQVWTPDGAGNPVTVLSDPQPGAWPRKQG